jgi:glycerol-3-phosphate dehydrogenase subunit C
MTVTIDPSHPMYLEQADVRNEMSRVFDICNGCRRCVGLCTSFPTLFEFIGRHADHDAGRMTPFEQDQVVDQCFQCTLCSLDCPYVGEPDDASVDFPRLMLRAKAMLHAEGIASTRGAARTHMVNHTDRLGKLATSTTPIIGPIIGSSANRILNRIARSPSGSSLRKLTARATGVSAVRLLPPYAKQRFSTWFAQRPSTVNPGPPARVTVYPTCVVEYQEPDIGKDLVKVYEHNGIGCTVSDAGCCGAPWLHSGDVEQFRKVAEKNVRVLAAEIRAGTDIVVAQPTCSQLVKQEYVTYVEGPDAELVAAHTYDACEYLMRMHAGDPSSLDVEFPGDRPGSITYHAPCHLRAQRIGPASSDLLALTGAEVTVVEQCSGTDGMWGLRAGNEDISVPMARQLGNRIDEAGDAVVAGDCHLANTAIVEQTGRTSRHPLQILARAYGLDED